MTMAALARSPGTTMAAFVTEPGDDNGSAGTGGTDDGGHTMVAEPTTAEAISKIRPPSR
jgi:hypothetical protein